MITDDERAGLEELIEHASREVKRGGSRLRLAALEAARDAGGDSARSIEIMRIRIETEPALQAEYAGLMARAGGDPDAFLRLYAATLRTGTES